MIIESGRSFKKDFSKLSRKQKDQFHKRMSLFVKEPNHPILRSHALQAGLKGKRSINISGDIRMIYEELGPDSILLLKIGTHSELYGG